jgi:hypothetical protein
MPKRQVPTAAPVAAPKAPVAAKGPKGPVLTAVPETFGEVGEVIRAAVTAAQQAKTLAASYRLVGGRSVATAEVAVGIVEKFHDKALERLVGDADFRVAVIDAAAAASNYDVQDIVGMVRGMIPRDQVVHPAALGVDGKSPIHGGASRDLRKAPHCFRAAAAARLDSLPFREGEGLMAFITARL